MENLGGELTASNARIAIVGGGYAGIAAAVKLAELGRPSVVFEAGKVLGGRARRIDYRDMPLDNGQHILSGAYTELLRMMELVGVPANALRRTPLNLQMPPVFSLRAPRLPAPFHLAWALVTAKGLSLGERWAAIRFMRQLKALHFKIDAKLTVQQLLDQYHQPAALVRGLWQPLTISALNTPIETASARVFVCVLRDALAASRDASDLMLPCTDLSTLFPDPAAAWLKTRGTALHTGARVSGISRCDQTLAPTWRIQSSAVPSLEREIFDRVILAVAPNQLDALSLPANLLPRPFSYEPIFTVYLQYAHPVRLAHPMLGQLSGHAQWFFDRGALAGKQGLVAAVISASGPHQQLSHDELAARVHAELVLHAGPLPHPLWHKVVAEKFATFACTADVVRPASTTSLPGIYLAGDYVDCDYPATLEAAVRNGALAAELVDASLKNS